MEITVDHRWFELITIQYKKAHIAQPLSLTKEVLDVQSVFVLFNKLKSKQSPLYLG